jgi:hypothetical protein
MNLVIDVIETANEVSDDDLSLTLAAVKASPSFFCQSIVISCM